jgi:hypothetical protein
MSVLSKLLALEPVDEHIVKMIVVAVELPADAVDFAALGADLAEARMVLPTRMTVVMSFGN